MKYTILINFFCICFFTKIDYIYCQNIMNFKTATEFNKVVRKNNQDTTVKGNLIEFQHVYDRDIMRSVVVWEVLDLNEKLNFPYYFPTDTNNIESNRRSLFDALVSGIRRGEIKEIYMDGYFLNKKSVEDIESSLVLVDTSELGIEQFNRGEQISSEYIDSLSISSKDILSYRIKGIWYFDKRYSEMKYRLIGLAPISIDISDKGKEDFTEVELFWVFFADARKVLAKTFVFNEKNVNHKVSYDEMLNTRRFTSVIYKEGNMYDDRNISDYIKENAIFQLRESEIIKEKIRNMELDMWNY